MLEKVIDVDQIPEKYIPYIADPIRRLVREKGNQHVLVENKLDYFKLYVSLGRKYPFDYLTAWIVKLEDIGTPDTVIGYGPRLLSLMILALNEL